MRERFPPLPISLLRTPRQKTKIIVPAPDRHTRTAIKALEFAPTKFKTTPRTNNNHHPSVPTMKLTLALLVSLSVLTAAKPDFVRKRKGQHGNGYGDLTRPEGSVPHSGPPIRSPTSTPPRADVVRKREGQHGHGHLHGNSIHPSGTGIPYAGPPRQTPKSTPSKADVVRKREGQHEHEHEHEHEHGISTHPSGSIPRSPPPMSAPSDTDVVRKREDQHEHEHEHEHGHGNSTHPSGNIPRSPPPLSAPSDTDVVRKREGQDEHEHGHGHGHGHGKSTDPSATPSA